MNFVSVTRLSDGQVISINLNHVTVISEHEGRAILEWADGSLLVKESRADIHNLIGVRQMIGSLQNRGAY